MSIRRMRSCAVTAIALAVAGNASAVTNIDPAVDGHRYGWSENGGWTNMRGDVANGVRVVNESVPTGRRLLQGYAWSENLGWINFGAGVVAVPPYYSNTGSEFGVNMDPSSGVLSGYAWGENIGWISFFSANAHVRISNNTGLFSGQAWSENIGWITFDGLSANVASTDPHNVPVKLTSFEMD